MKNETKKLMGFSKVLRTYVAGETVDVTPYFKAAKVNKYSPTENNYGGYRASATRNGYKLKIQARPFRVLAKIDDPQDPNFENWAPTKTVMKAELYTAVTTQY